MKHPVSAEQKAINDDLLRKAAWLLQHPIYLSGENEPKFLQKVPGNIDKFGSLTEKMVNWIEVMGKRVKKDRAKDAKLEAEKDVSAV